MELEKRVEHLEEHVQELNVNVSKIIGILEVLAKKQKESKDDGIYFLKEV